MTSKKEANKEQTYKGYQLLRMEKYDNRVARIVIDGEREYSFEDADRLISEYLAKKG